jgi:hypothetical protein
MRENLRYVVALALVAVLGGLALGLRPTDPNFHGKPESFWINSITNGGQMVFVVNSDGSEGVSFPTWEGFGPEGVTLLVKALRKGTGAWDRFYFKHWPKLPPLLRRWLAKPVDESELRCQSMLILSVMGSDARIALPALVQALHDENDDVRGSALYNLSLLLPGMREQKVSLLPQLLDATRDAYPRARRMALICLGEYPDQASKVVPLVVNALNDSDMQVRDDAIRSLTRLNEQGANKAVVPALCKLLQDGNAQLRKAATNALSLLQAERTTDVTDATDKIIWPSPPSNP